MAELKLDRTPVSPARIRHRPAGLWWRRALGTRRRRFIALGCLAAAAIYPFAVGGIAARLATAEIAKRVAAPVRMGSALAGLTGIRFKNLAIGSAEAPLVRVDRVEVPYLAVLLRRGTIEVSGLAMTIRHGGADDNVSAIVQAFRDRRKAQAKGSAGSGEGNLPALVIHEARLNLKDASSGLSIDIPRLTGALRPGDHLEVTFAGIDGRLMVSTRGNGPRFGAESVTLTAPLLGLRPMGYPTLAIVGGFASPLPTLSLTGIRGTIRPGPAGPAAAPGPSSAAPSTGGAAAGHALLVNLDGSYGGARETLWTAHGGIDPEAHEGQLSLVAERFSLGEIVDVLPKTVLSPTSTQVNAAFDVSWADGAVRFGGDLEVGGLSVAHAALSSDPIRDLDLSLVLRGTAFPAARRVSIERLEARVHELRGTLTGFVELAPGTFAFEDGNKLGFLPRLELTLEVPRLPCAKVLSSLPPTLIPRMQGFELQGVFGAQIETRVDYANLDQLELKGKIGIDGCRVVKAPADVQALVGGDSVVQHVQIPRAYGSRKTDDMEDTETMEFILGPENPDFVPYEDISPAFIAAIMTTEDNGFFKHRGWVTSEFKTALKRNLRRGGFRGGASSITMQMVKNVLLTQEKTLSRKLQELFLVWYLEQEVPKERILELYFNAIEFGPRIYGIGPAARHYFGKDAADLTPLEGAFFSSILPSPKRRYIQYCHGAPAPAWDRYVRRILGKVHERGRLTDEEYATALEEKLVFDRRETNFNERQCLEWVKKITARPEPEAPPDADVPIGNDSDADADADIGPLPRKLRRLFANDSRRAAAARSGKTARP